VVNCTGPSPLVRLPWTGKWHEHSLNGFDWLKIWQNWALPKKKFDWVWAGNSNWGVKLSTHDLLIKLACFVKRVNIIFWLKTSSCKVVNCTGPSPLVRLPWTGKWHEHSLNGFDWLKIWPRALPKKLDWVQAVNSNWGEDSEHLTSSLS